MPNRGILTISYYSGEGVGKKNCKPYVSFRKSLLRLTSHNEKDRYFLIENKPSPDVLPGDICFKKLQRKNFFFYYFIIIIIIMISNIFFYFYFRFMG